MRRALAAMIGITMLAVASMAAASSFSLSPLGLSIRANEASGAVTARNQGSETIVIQVRAFTWSQDAEGAEKRTETQDLIINPAVFRIGPGEEQFVRIGPKGSRARDAERAYRLVFSEVLPTLPPGAQSALRMSLAMDVPLYVEPATAIVAGPLTWSAQRTATGYRIKGANAGGRHVRLTDVVVVGDGHELQRHPHLVVLGRSSRALDLDAPGDRSILSLTLTANDDNGSGTVQAVSFEIPVAPRP